MSDKRKNILFAAVPAVSAAAFAVCSFVFIYGVYLSAGEATGAFITYLLGTLMFVLADVIAACSCIAGKMPDERSIVYSVSRLFVISFTLNFSDRCSLLFIPLALSSVMYFLSLCKDFRKFAARHGKKSEVTQ